ncbi:hypothetical protein VNO77_23381 [Canavalia gladiata]|uniref:Uncharacterized protein n=1 Tax=Canavalia gladiata TaxID=3824 RepID=A0AAN9L7Q5_CANGL
MHVAAPTPTTSRMEQQLVDEELFKILRQVPNSGHPNCGGGAGAELTEQTMEKKRRLKERKRTLNVITLEAIFKIDR